MKVYGSSPSDQWKINEKEAAKGLKLKKYFLLKICLLIENLKYLFMQK